MNYLWPALTVLFSLPILKMRARPLLAPGTLLALCGAFLVLIQGASVSWRSFSSHVTSNPLAYALGLAGAVSWPLYSNLARHWAVPHNAGAAP